MSKYCVHNVLCGGPCSLCGDGFAIHENIVLGPAGAAQLAYMLENPRPPTPALVELMKGDVKCTITRGGGWFVCGEEGNYCSDLCWVTAERDRLREDRNRYRDELSAADARLNEMKVKLDRYKGIEPRCSCPQLIYQVFEKNRTLESSCEMHEWTIVDVVVLNAHKFADKRAATERASVVRYLRAILDSESYDHMGHVASFLTWLIPRIEAGDHSPAKEKEPIDWTKEMQGFEATAGEDDGNDE